MSGMRPAAAMIFSAFADIRNFRNATACCGCFDDFETANPSPAYCTTPFCGFVENGGTIGATFEPSPFSSVAVSQLPSMIIAAWPFMNVPRMLVFVSTSLLVQPFWGRLAQLLICETMFVEFHGICPS